MPINQAGRQVKIMIGREGTAGILSTQLIALPYSSDPNLSPTIETAVDNSGVGRKETSIRSIKVGEMLDETLSTFIDSDNIGHILHGVFGTLVTQVDTPEVGVNTHDFSQYNDGIHPSYSLIYQDKNLSKEYLNCIFKTVNFNFTEKAISVAEFGLVGKLGGDYAPTVNYNCANTSTKLFIPEKVSIKFANDVASLAGATAIPFSNFSININTNAVGYQGLGYATPSRVFDQVFDVQCQGSVIYESAFFYDLSFNQTEQAVQVFLEGVDNLGATSTKASLSFIMPKVNVTSNEISNPMDGFSTQSVTCNAHFDFCDLTEERAITAHLVNEQANSIY